MKKIILVLIMFVLAACQPVGQLLALSTPTGINVSPGQSIQSVCLDVVQPGQTCTIQAGTYNESLILKRSGTQANPITLIANGIVTVNSGNARTIYFSGRMEC